MKKQPGKDMIIFGSGSIVSQLTQHDLIDEYHFTVGRRSSEAAGRWSAVCRRA